MTFPQGHGGRVSASRAACCGSGLCGLWWYLGRASVLPVSHEGSLCGASGGLRSCRRLAGTPLRERSRRLPGEGMWHSERGAWSMAMRQA